mmetsp:Transcript_15721/g.22770  ORF Transcript_15721/g.22770 Transcript_15721/m.22770 type:complete len:194 (-) Transcript_15721:33-614(-)|eukprot:CAMPEP_0202440392 /NCGR_PEP_ID=MMETSP1345-20130828/36665_1 /ASSEMBLY_ACC=CAM_ASM_000843 /TAXON_ID=342563 /ORGANISM="Fabrea Fabrea salina" /LENGTH=193 /DNA_ID=CAMNT_0049054981 /DNA_START=259 /DNA_END=843 /DNA_ORIENTATION=-
MLAKRLLRYIQIKSTPNPACLKFLTDEQVLSEGTCDFADPKFASISPLATEIFELPGVNRVFFAKDYVSVTKNEEVPWEALQDTISSVIEQYLTEKRPIFTDDAPQEEDNYDSDSEVIQIIKEILEGRVRPHVQEDGGDIKFLGFDEETGVVSLELRGSCVGCPSSSATLKDGIEKMIMFYLPEVKGVRAVDN